MHASADGRPTPARTALGLLTIYVVWGSTFAAVTIAVRDLPPLLAMGLRHVSAGVILLGWSARRPAALGEIGRRQIVAATIFGGALFLGAHGSLAWAQQTVPSGVAALLIASIPLWMALLDRVVFGKRLHRLAYAGLASGFVGIGLLVDPFGARGTDRLGAVVIVLSALSWAAGSLYSRGAPLPRAPLVSAGLAALCGGALLLVVATATGEWGDATFTADALAAVAYLIVVGTLVGFVTYVWLLQTAPTSLVSTYAYANPVVAVLLGWAFLGEDVTWTTVGAGALIVVSVALIVATSGAELDEGRGLRRRRVPAPEAVSAPVREGTTNAKGGPMAPDRDELEGKAKQFEGKLTGDSSREAEGDVQEGWGNVKDKAEDKLDDATDRTRD